jgi:hypothetical protein
MALRLRHQLHNRPPRLTFYFYDGHLPVDDGVIVIPDGRIVWAQAAWQRGYTINADTGQRVELYDLPGLVLSGQTAAETAESEEDVVGSFGRGQSPSDDGFRESEQPSAGESPDEGDGSSIGDGPTVRTEGSGLEALL